MALPGLSLLRATLLLSLSITKPNSVSAQDLSLSASLANNEVHLRISGGTSANVAVLASPDLISWQQVTNVSLTPSGDFVESIDFATNRFYRAVAFPAGMIMIPAGSFEMGNSTVAAPNDETGAATWEFPVHTVTVSAFAIEATEVTKGQWDSVYAWALDHGYTFDNPGAGKGANHPVQKISFYDILKWCNARSEMEGKVPSYYTDAELSTVYRTGQRNLPNEFVNWNAGYRLPTEAEWEKAARGGIAGRRFPWGATIGYDDANYDSALWSYDDEFGGGWHPAYRAGGFPYTAPVGSFPPNDYGLLDMVGNIQERVWDQWSDTYYSVSPPADPLGPTSSFNTDRVVRGGAWTYGSAACRLASRTFRPPTFTDNATGFRSVISIDFR